MDKVFNNNIYVIGTTLDQNKVNNFKGIKTGVILFGNESKGISKKLENYISDWISIERIGSAESLNVSVSSGIILEKLLNS